VAWVFFLQRRDEDRHALIFDRIAAEVLGLPGATPAERREAARAHVPAGVLELFEVKLPRLRSARGRGRPGRVAEACMEGGFVKTRPLRPLEAVRGFGVMLAGSIALAAAAAASGVAVARAFMSVRSPSPLALFGTARTAIYALVIRPWHLCWGAEAEDEKRPLPGDELLPKDGTQTLHAVTIHARSRRCGPGSPSWGHRWREHKERNRSPVIRRAALARRIAVRSPASDNDGTALPHTPALPRRDADAAPRACRDTDLSLGRSG
jgi:hypothetical protein